MTNTSTKIKRSHRQAQGQWNDLALHTLGWKAFQDLCSHVCEEILERPVEVYREAQDGGQDAVFLTRRPQYNGHAEATIQCKFSSKAGRKLKASDLTTEEATVASLVANEQAQTYVLITSMSVDAPVAIKIKKRLRELGVKRPHVFGQEFLTQAIRRSVRLRALVPRVYGLGDLSTILDERVAQQTKALLGHMEPSLKVYVPTEPHVMAVRALAEHGIVLLLGDPATGKSTIAAVLATTAAEDPSHRCFKADGPDELFDNWNPNESGGFYWIDDAFGPNQLREDFVDRWIQNMPKLQAAVPGGNQFVLTSRKHIYLAAQSKLGTRNHPLFRDKSAIVDVGALNTDERRQILYNHIKAGRQSRMWKSRVKNYLEMLSNEPAFLPEIARRLSDPIYTKRLTLLQADLLTFVREPQEHLLQTIQELSRANRAALTLVFLHRSQMPSGGADPSMMQLVEKHFGIDADSIGQAIQQMRDSFLIEKFEESHRFWAFKHPTIADAISAILGEAEGMVELYLRGTKVPALLQSAVCHGVAPIHDAIIVPETLNALLVNRLLETPNEPLLNRQLFAFLHERASDDVIRLIVEAQPSVLDRPAYVSWRLWHDPKINVHARAHSLGILPNHLRQETAARLELALFEDVDTSFLDSDSILALFQSSALLHLLARVRRELFPNLPAIAESIADEADLDIEPEDNFDNLSSAVTAFNERHMYERQVAQHIVT